MIFFISLMPCVKSTHYLKPRNDATMIFEKYLRAISGTRGAGKVQHKTKTRKHQ